MSSSSLKTRKSVAKRVKRITRTGKLIARMQSSQHLTGRKSKRTLAQSGRARSIRPVQAKNLIAQLG